MLYCCEFLEKQLTNKCDQHGLECPDNVIREFKENFGIPHPDGVSYYKIDFCPFCGSKLPII